MIIKDKEYYHSFNYQYILIYNKIIEEKEIIKKTH